MRTDVRLEGWRIAATGAAAERFHESVFFTGNGRMGARGYVALRPEPRPLDAGLFMAGMFDRITESSPLTDFVNLPTPIYLGLEAGGAPLGPAAEVERELDLSSGLLSLRYAAQGPGGSTEVYERRFFSMARPGWLFQRVELTEGAGLCLRAGIDCAARNSPIPDDQVKENSETLRMTRLISHSGGPEGLTAAFSTLYTGLGLDMELRVRSEGLEFAAYEPSEEGLYLRFMGRGGPAAIEIGARIRTSRDIDPLAGLDIGSDWSFGSALEAERSAWRELWEERGIEIEGDEAAQTAMRYVIYQ